MFLAKSGHLRVIYAFFLLLTIPLEVKHSNPLSRAGLRQSQGRREGISDAVQCLPNRGFAMYEVSPRRNCRARPTLTNGYSAGGPLRMVALELKH